jgi:hypothetical protein
MKSEPRAARLLMPWLAPLVLAILYLAQLWHEGAFADPAGPVIQITVGVPLVIAGRVLLAAAEQEVRTRLLPDTEKRLDGNHRRAHVQRCAGRVGTRASHCR